jgi:hypothetical protein
VTSTEPTDTTIIPDPRPRIRAASVAWGLIVIAVSTTVIWVVSAASRRALFDDWILGLTPASITVLAVLLLGAILLLVGILVGIRRLQQRE